MSSSAYGFIWREDIGIVDLNTLLDVNLADTGWVVITDGNINNDNMITTVAYYNTNTKTEMQIHL